MCVMQSAPVSVGSAQYNVQVERMRSLLTPNRDPSSGLPPSTLYLIGDSHAESISLGMGLALRGRYQLRWASQPSEGFICTRPWLNTQRTGHAHCMGSTPLADVG
jgi:hypothetical protein